MKGINFASISNKLALLVVFAVLPGLALLLYTGLELRQQSIEGAKRDVALLTHAMAETQKEVTRSTRQFLATLSLTPEVQALDPRAGSELFRAVLEQNPNYYNIVLVDPAGDVIASGREFSGINLADRKHVRDALEKKDFAVGEYIVTRVGTPVPAFAFAYPVLDKGGRAIGVVTTVIRLNDFSLFYDFSILPEKSFVAVTDHQGVRLFYYPAQDQTNPVGKPIRSAIWQEASARQGPGIIIGSGSDGLRRVFAFEQVQLDHDSVPYLYVWAGIPESHILASANAAMARNLLLIVAAMVISLVVTRVIGKKTVIAPVHALVDFTRRFARGGLVPRSELAASSGELGTLARAFHDMADAIRISQDALRVNEARFRLLMNSLDALVYVADMETYEILFINEYGKEIFGDLTGKICWQGLQKDQDGPCDFCTNRYLLNREGKPGEIYQWEFQNTTTARWFDIRDRAIPWVDGRVVRLEIANDITGRKEVEREREQLIVKLQGALDQVKTLSGLLPICASCKRIRDDKGYWNQIESYIKKHSEAEFSHGICPECIKKLYSDYIDENGKIG